jgi:hypothetical protein
LENPPLPGYNFGVNAILVLVLASSAGNALGLGGQFAVSEDIVAGTSEGYLCYRHEFVPETYLTARIAYAGYDEVHQDWWSSSTWGYEGEGVSVSLGAARTFRSYAYGPQPGDTSCCCLWFPHRVSSVNLYLDLLGSLVRYRFYDDYHTGSWCWYSSAGGAAGVGLEFPVGLELAFSVNVSSPLPTLSAHAPGPQFPAWPWGFGIDARWWAFRW